LGRPFSFWRKIVAATRFTQRGRMAEVLSFNDIEAVFLTRVHRMV
jgi:hypothetical protein